MKSKVILSIGNVIWSIIIIVMLSSLLIYFICRHDLAAWIPLAASLLLWTAANLFYLPRNITVDDTTLTIHMPLRTKTIPLASITDATLRKPGVNSRRICGSAGTFGYWGWFSQPGIGRYFAYHGRIADCFLITLDNGRRYMLGCAEPDRILHHLTRRNASATAAH